MKKLIDTIFKRLKLRKMQTKVNQVQVELTSYSQPHVLQQRMRQEHLTHGQTVKADISPVRIESSYGGHVTMYFCPTQDLIVKQNLSFGDGGNIPDEATLQNINFPSDLKPGLYNLKNVKLFSNGSIQVIATEETVFEEYEPCSRQVLPF